jgi:hypothetical protein
MESNLTLNRGHGHATREREKAPRLHEIAREVSDVDPNFFGSRLEAHADGAF